jgi:hypothetical protein
MNRKMKRLILPVGAAAIIGTSGFAYMANVNIPDSHVGQGVGTVSDYNASHITYQTTTVDQESGPPITVIPKLTFTLDHYSKASNVDAFLSGGCSTWSYRSCESSDNYTFTCKADGGASTQAPSGKVYHLTISAGQ